MTQIENSAILVINALSIGRGDGPDIIRDILSHRTLVLSKLRQWRICAGTLAALWDIEGRSRDDCPLVAGKLVWVCEVGSLAPEINAFNTLEEWFGPEDRDKWISTHLRWRYSSYKTMRKATNRIDNVIHLTNPDKIELIRDLLF